MPEVRLIDKTAAYKALKHEAETHELSFSAEAYDRAARIIDQMPAIEAEPVRHGSWETWGYVFHGIEWKRCSRCGKYADVSYYGLLDGQIRMSTPAICGVCGARMDATDKNVGGKGGADNG